MKSKVSLTGNRMFKVILTGSLAVTGSLMLFRNESSIHNEMNGNSFQPPITGQNRKQGVSMLSPAQVSAWLRENEESYFVNRGKGVLRYDISQLPSNNPIEDDHSEKIVQVPLIMDSEERVNTDWMFWGVYDGHSGWTTSAKLRDSLINYVLAELDHVYAKASPNTTYRLPPSDEEVDEAIRQGFLKLDDEIVHKSVEKLLTNSHKSGAAEIIAPALSGSCALLTFYESHSNKLRVALAGDSRAVLGSRNNHGQWTATALTTDQTGSNHEEANRVRSEHPGEETTAIKNGRVLGSLEPTRAFGDARYKWTRDIQHKVASAFFGRRTPAELRSPPYVTARPVVTTAQVRPELGDFVVVGSDGLFEMLSNEEIVTLVAKWIETKSPDYSVSVGPSNQSFLGRLFKSNSRTESVVEDISQNKEALKQPLRRRGTGLRMAVEDDNCATHLIRNALGGADKEQVSMLISIPSPMSRSYRDDLTVAVIFFGHDGSPNDAGSVRLNGVASQPVKRSKL